MGTESLPIGSTECIIKTDDLEVYADPLFERVIFNLIDNALRYGGDALTRITIFWHTIVSGICLVMEDNGAGIMDDNKEKIFKRGFGQNTGFGLFLAREILGLTGIEIKETGTYGTGARLEMIIPQGLYRFSHNPILKE